MVETISGSNLRLEILRLVHRHDLPPEQVTARASDLEKWVLSTETKPGTLTLPRGPSNQAESKSRPR